MTLGKNQNIQQLQFCTWQLAPMASMRGQVSKQSLSFAAGQPCTCTICLWHRRTAGFVWKSTVARPIASSYKRELNSMMGVEARRTNWSEREVKSAESFVVHLAPISWSSLQDRR